MKNDKICINKSVMFIATVLVILVGVVMATNYVNNQKVSTKSRAENNALNALGGPVPVAEAGKFALSELKARVVEAIAKLDNVLVVSLNKDQVNAKKEALSTSLTLAEGAFANVQSKLSSTVKNLELLSTTNKTNKKTAEEKVAKLLTDLTKAKEDVKAQQVKVDQRKALVSTTEEEYKKADGEYVFEINVLKQNIGILTNSLDAITTNNPIDSLVGKSAKDLSSRLSGADYSNLELLKKIDVDATNRPNSGEPADPGVNSIIEDLYVVDSGLQIKYENFQNSLKLVGQKKKAADDIKLVLGVQQADLARNEGFLSDYKKVEADTQKEYEYTQKTVLVYGSIEDSLQTTLGKVKALSVSETAKLPAGVPAVTKISGDTYGANVMALDSAQTEIDNGVNAPLIAANTAYEALDKSISDGLAKKDSELKSYGDYCKNLIAYKDKDGKVVGQVFYPLLDENGEVPWFASDKYNQTCKPNANNPLWNGEYGSDAKCFTATGLCSTVQNAERANQIANIGPNNEFLPETCINRELVDGAGRSDMTMCINAGRAPKSAQKSIQECIDNAIFAWVGIGSYQVADIYKYVGVQPSLTPAPKNGRSDTCVLLRPGTTNEPCLTIKSEFCQRVDAGFKAVLDKDGKKTNKFYRESTKEEWNAPPFK